MVSEQWFVDVKEAADEGIKAISEKAINVVPERFNKTFYQWLGDIQPWCISRQLRW
jgi:valyl-tRNA synthetase